MARGKVTAETVKALRASASDSFLWDDRLAGFGVKVTPAGAKIYVLQYRLGGRGSKVRRYTIGKEGAFRAQSARMEAERLSILVSQGVDIVAAAKERTRVTTDLAFDKYVATFCGATLKVAWPKSWQQTKRCLELHGVKHLGDKPLPSITVEDVRRLLKRLDAQPATKRNLFAALSYLFNKSVEDGLIPTAPTSAMKAPPQVEGRTRTLNEDELRWLWEASDKESDAYAGIVRTLIRTGQRRSEVSSLPWRELSRERLEWHLPKERAKNGCENVIPLTAEIVADLDKIAGGTRWPRQGLVFPSSAGTAPSGFSKVKARLDSRMAEAAKKAGADIEPWTLHDLRRTLATNMQRLGVSYEVIEHLLNHREKTRTGIGKVYQTHDFKDEKLAALEKWEVRINQIINGSTGVVVPFGRRA